MPLTVGYIAWQVYRAWDGGSDEQDLWPDSATLGSDSLFNLDTLPNTGQAYWYAPGVYWERKVGGCPSSLGVATCYELHLTALIDWGAGHHRGVGLACR